MICQVRVIGALAVVILVGHLSLHAADRSPSVSGRAASVHPPASRSAAVAPEPQRDGHAAAMSAEQAQATIGKYCVGCHNAKTKAGDLVLDGLPLDHLTTNADKWEKAIRKLRI